jgi:uncharacterized membrane protein YraQ (UPF0718 family)
VPTVEIIAIAVITAVLLREPLASLLDTPTVQTWATIFVSIVVQAMPFLVLGSVLGAAIATFVPARWLQRALPRNRVAAVCAATGAGVLLPGCECGSVPISGRLMSRGVLPAAALAFMLSAPAINPVVLVSTAVAFPGRPDMVIGRFVASAVTAVVMGLVWLRVDPESLLQRVRRGASEDGNRAVTFVETMRHDFLHAGGYLVVGAAVAGGIQTLVPRTFLERIGGQTLLAVTAMGLLAVILSVCSEADAFVAASFTEFSPVAQLTFMVVGPVVDLKLVSLQGGIFGRSFASRFAPLTLLVAVLAAVLIGSVLL